MAVFAYGVGSLKQSPKQRPAHLEEKNHEYNYRSSYCFRPDGINRSYFTETIDLDFTSLVGGEPTTIPADASATSNKLTP